MSDIPFTPKIVDQDGKEHPISAATVIGRAPDCQIQIEQPGVSRRHAQFEISGDKVLLKDLESSNGTFVNGLRIQVPTELSDGDQIRIQDNLFTYRAPAPAAAPEPAPQAAAAAAAPAAAPAQAESGSPKTSTYPSLTLLALVRSDNGAETGLSRTIRIGRDEANEISLPKDSSASSAHAKIETMGGQVVLTDLGSSNGTWVNGVRITSPVTLSH
ncbi:MAG: FHA domain-containing protein, partial [Anaerolineales bacterium]|nr:FHA domain-containing protein [Anaerolineales bacterium]